MLKANVSMQIAKCKYVYSSAMEYKKKTLSGQDNSPIDSSLNRKMKTRSSLYCMQQEATCLFQEPKLTTSCCPYSSNLSFISTLKAAFLGSHAPSYFPIDFVFCKLHFFKLFTVSFFPNCSLYFFCVSALSLRHPQMSHEFNLFRFQSFHIVLLS